MIYLNADCMNPETGLPSYPDNHFDLAIVDPPYGIMGKFNGGKRGNAFVDRYKKGSGWDERPEKDYFQQLYRVSKNQIICGANYFVEFLPVSRGWVFWDKCGDGMSTVNNELIFTSFERCVETFRRVHGLDKGFMVRNQIDAVVHPTQKPIALYKWLLKNYAKEGDLILDTHVGSASSLIAFEEMGFNYVGFELDADYYQDSCKRIEAFRAQPKLFTGKEVFEASKPPTLFE